MSDKDLDKLFKGKLEDFAPEPSPGAWEKVSGQLQPGRKAFAWWHIAAAVLLVLGAGAVIMLGIGSSSQDMPLAVNEPASEATKAPAGAGENAEIDRITAADSALKSAADQNPDTEIPIPSKDTDAGAISAENTDNRLAVASSTEATDEVSEKVSGAADGSDIPEPDQPAAAEVLAGENDALLAIEEIQPEPAATEEVRIAQATTAVTGTTLSFKIEDFPSAQYEDEKSDSLDENNNGLKKMWSIIKQVKEPEAGLGNLREMKNELFAFRKAKKDEDKQ